MVLYMQVALVPLPDFPYLRIHILGVSKVYVSFEDFTSTIGFLVDRRLLYGLVGSRRSGLASRISGGTSFLNHSNRWSAKGWAGQ
jgi:hypothetical protein